jgi:hypothetical protein
MYVASQALLSFYTMHQFNWDENGWYFFGNNRLLVGLVQGGLIRY